MRRVQLHKAAKKRFFENLDTRTLTRMALIGSSTSGKKKLNINITVASLPLLRAIISIARKCLGLLADQKEIMFVQ